MCGLIHITSAGIYLLAYLAAALYAHHANQHKDLCIFYILFALAACLHLSAIVFQMVGQRNESADGNESFSTPSPIANAKRIEYYDDRGLLTRVEWEPLTIDDYKQNIHQLPDDEKSNKRPRLVA